MRRRPSDHASDDLAGRLYDRFAAELYRYALMILASADDAAEVVQEVFLATLRQKRDIACDEAYLRRATRNACFSLLRKRRRDAHRSEDSSLLETIPTAADRPCERLAVEQAIRALPPEQREAVHLKTFCGMTFQEIAAATEESVNTVASRYPIRDRETAGPGWAPLQDMTMDDEINDELESLVRRYRPKGPPIALRDRFLMAAGEINQRDGPGFPLPGLARHIGVVPLGPWLDAELGAIRMSLLRCARTVVALVMYRQHHNGRLPERLADLLPVYLEKPLVDPFSGQALRFHVDTAAYEINSQGPRDHSGASRHLPAAIQAGTNTDNLGLRIRRRIQEP